MNVIVTLTFNEHPKTVCGNLGHPSRGGKSLLELQSTGHSIIRPSVMCSTTLLIYMIIMPYLSNFILLGSTDPNFGRQYSKIDYSTYVKLQADFVGVASYFAGTITSILTKTEPKDRTKGQDHQL